eukprot:CAMPEP_0181222514 /NCGR_PEP_ID=MMETSP1096-20121128/30007_1 /TAXON_ID=156174 ORGANISM="Chrysochromulina ericina, Strain CCMP281" /NCGR_SAMPLE_ID=MMETSP1096 /ASSEMBLY_ACC=CAM_ASM_000453 /LENGTH=32 /DNA_ID= /DNA_START= /DNA_END= /DNA_ORIENTATION=
MAVQISDVHIQAQISWFAHLMASVTPVVLLNA